MNDPHGLIGPIVLLGRCGLDRLAAPLRALTGAEVIVSGFTDAALARRVAPSLVYVDLFGWDLLGPICAAALTGASPPLPLGLLGTIVAELAGLPVVYRGLRRPSAGSLLWASAKRWLTATAQPEHWPCTRPTGRATSATTTRTFS